MDDHSERFASKLSRALPDLLHKRTGGVVLLDVHLHVLEAALKFKGGPKRRHNDHIVLPQGVEGHELPTQRVVQKGNPPALQVGIDLRVVNHLTQQKDALAWIFIDRLVADFNGVLHPKTKSKVPRKPHLHLSKVQIRG